VRNWGERRIGAGGMKMQFAKNFLIDAAKLLE
jgi:hypothetical protein